MATLEQIKALIRSHFDGDNERFKTVALQIAAHEARVGHTSSAKEIKNLVQNSKVSSGKVMPFGKKIDSLEQRDSYVDMLDIVLSESLENKVKRIIFEFQKKDVLRKNGLKNRSKILLVGEPGTGKTMTASVIANEINLPLYIIQIDKLVTKYMGETSVKLRQVFDYIEEYPGVYLFDEFDAIGSDRGMDNDVGEMRRILNSFLQYLENEDSFSLIIAATNNPNILDKALFRRFDDVLEYSLPDKDQILRIIKNKLEGHSDKNIYESEVIETAIGLSHSDISKACEEALKYSIMYETIIDKEIIIGMLQNRRELYRFKEA
ncbi:MAG: ATP-binding protein [Lachnospiraceae bacterium]|nr:ATP-binding protein [Lachnospiraceae bacterium]